MRKILAFTGVKFSGKTTAFNIIKEEIPNVIEIQLAKKLKDECARVFKIERNLFDDPNLKETTLDNLIYLDPEELQDLIESYGVTPNYDKHIRPHVGTVLESPRRVAQYIGTEVLRGVSPDIHCIGATLDLPDNTTFVLTDMRFPNEYEFFSKRYGNTFFPFYIQNNHAEFNASKDMHPSERMVLETAKKCKLITNNDSISDFKSKILQAIKDTECGTM